MPRPKELRTQWSPPRIGEAEEQRHDEFGGDVAAALHAQRLSASWRWIVTKGVDEEVLKRGPGQYPGTAGPGEPGNFAVAGHRATYGEPFAHLDRLRSGDRVVVETREAWYVYRVQRTRIVSPQRTDLIADVPGYPGKSPDGAYLTLTTCHPRWSSAERLVVTAELARSLPYEKGPPSGVRALCDQTVCDQ